MNNHQKSAFYSMSNNIQVRSFYLLNEMCMHPPGGATAVTAIIGGATIHNIETFA
jgi:CBS-domain-containing membrane protein